MMREMMYFIAFCRLLLIRFPLAWKKAGVQVKIQLLQVRFVNQSSYIYHLFSRNATKLQDRNITTMVIDAVLRERRAAQTSLRTSFLSVLSLHKQRPHKQCIANFQSTILSTMVSSSLSLQIRRCEDRSKKDNVTSIIFLLLQMLGHYFSASIIITFSPVVMLLACGIRH